MPSRRARCCWHSARRRPSTATWRIRSSGSRRGPSPTPMSYASGSARSGGRLRLGPGGIRRGDRVGRRADRGRLGRGHRRRTPARTVVPVPGRGCDGGRRAGHRRRGADRPEPAAGGVVATARRGGLRPVGGSRSGRGRGVGRGEVGAEAWVGHDPAPRPKPAPRSKPGRGPPPEPPAPPGPRRRGRAGADRFEVDGPDLAGLAALGPNEAAGIAPVAKRSMTASSPPYNPLPLIRTRLPIASPGRPIAAFTSIVATVGRSGRVSGPVPPLRTGRLAVLATG